MSDLLFSVFPNENFVDLGLYQYGWEQCAPAHSFGPAARNHYIFHYVISGTGTLLADDEHGNTTEWQVKSGQGFMLFPGQVNTYIADSKLPWEYTWVEFDGLRAREIVTTAGLSPNEPVYHASSKELRNQMMEEMLYLSRHSEESPFHLIGHLYLFLDYFMRSAATVHVKQNGSIRNFYIKEALSYIEQNFQNDISFGVNGKVLVLTEHQSTINRNMPLRSLLYIGRTYEQLVPVRERYRKGMVKLPMPEFYTFYNGTEKLENESELKLSDAYLMQDGNPMLELKARVININPSAKHEILDKCDVLKEYGLFIDTVRKYQDAGTKEAYRYAIQECIEKGILAGYLRKKGSEVINMLIAEYDYEMDIAVQREEAYEEGEKEGCLEALLEILKYKDNIPEKLEEKLKQQDAKTLKKWLRFAVMADNIGQFENAISE